jgi:hypothetical protein
VDKNAIDHDWVENNHEYDGVLVCKNSLKDWDKNSIFRAFQIYQFNDATMPGNDPTYVHLDTGVIVRYDGEVLVIERGQGQLENALLDLFDVLYSLGWRSADLYHPVETIGELLIVMGRAIPARLDFDIQAAQAKHAVSEFAESVAMVALATAGGTDAANTILLNEMQAMDTSMALGASISQGVPQAKRAFILIDEDEMTPSPLDNDQILVAQTSSFNPVQAESGITTAEEIDNFNEQPPLFVIPVNQDDTFQDDRRQDAPVFNSGAGPFVNAEVLKTPDATVAEIAVVQPFYAPPLVLAVEDQNADVLMISTKEMTLNKCINVGVSVFCFNFPSAPVSSSEITAITDEFYIEEWDVVHMHPGAMNGSIRWDVLGEISSEYPWFSEKLVSAMFGDQGDSALIACIIMALKVRNLAQLRDLLAFENETQSDMATMLAAISPAAQALFVRSGTRGSRAPTMDEVVRRLGVLALTPGGAFVDVRPSPMDIEEGEIGEVFTVRTILQSSRARLFVVNVDQLDGPFVLWIVGLLQFVAANYGATTRYSPGDAEVADGDAIAHRLADEAEQERQSQKAAAIDDATTRFHAVVTELRELGMSI